MSGAMIVIVILLVLLIGGLPNWYRGSAYGSWGYYPSGVVGILLVILILLLLFGVIPGRPL
jgi:hypothetical protein